MRYIYFLCQAFEAESIVTEGVIKETSSLSRNKLNLKVKHTIQGEMQIIITKNFYFASPWKNMVSKFYF